MVLAIASPWTIGTRVMDTDVGIEQSRKPNDAALHHIEQGWRKGSTLLHGFLPLIIPRLIRCFQVEC